MSLNGGNNQHLSWYPKAPPLSFQDKAKLWSIALGIVGAIGWIFWMVI